jgi:hypothetical protein
MREKEDQKGTKCSMYSNLLMFPKVSMAFPQDAAPKVMVYFSK